MPITSNAKDVQAWVRGVNKKMPAVTQRALNNTAFDVRTELIEEISRVYDRPTRGTLNAVRVKRATRSDLSAQIYIHDWFAGKGIPPVKYLRATIAGGQRRHKRFERWLIHVGVMSRNEYAVPGEAIRLNKFGNITAGQYSKIIADLGHVKPGGHQATSKVGKKRYFYDPNIRPRAIWKRLDSKGKRIVPALVFVKSARYQKIFRFYENALKLSEQKMPRQYRRALQYELTRQRR